MSVPLHPLLPSPPTHSAFMSQEEPADRSPGPKVRTEFFFALETAPPALVFLFLCGGSGLWLPHLLHCSMWWPPQAALDGSGFSSFCICTLSLFGITHNSLRKTPSSILFPVDLPVVWLCSLSEEENLDKPRLKFQFSVNRHRPNNRKQLEYLFKNTGLLELQPLVLTPFYESLCMFF